MAISKNILLNEVTGSINKQIVIRRAFGKTIISAYPDMEGIIWSKDQLSNQDVMRQANEESRRIRSDQQLRNEAMIRLNVTRNRLHNALIKEYFAKMRGEDVVGGSSE